MRMVKNDSALGSQQHTIGPDEVARAIEANGLRPWGPRGSSSLHAERGAAVFSLQKHDRYCVLDPAGLPQQIRERMGWTNWDHHCLRQSAFQPWSL
jgi:hypothetical protein